ncbi:MAG: ZIP family metal transporter [Bacilli bacterium]|nr:ZIP family metal transporter [Bacilli bacterium]
MQNLAWIALVTFIAGVLGTGVGGLVGALLRKDSSKVVSLLLSFAAGVMLAVVCFDLMPSALKPEEGGSEVPFYLVIIFVALGYVLVQLINQLIDKHSNKEVPHVDENHPKTHDDLDELIHADHLTQHKEKGTSLFMAGLIMAIVIALHNLPEGMVIGASYALTPEKIVGGGGFLIAVVIALHNIPEGMAVAVPLIAGGMKKPKAVLLTALSGLPTVIGALIGFSLGMINTFVLSICLSLASGAMLYVIFGELLPESILMWKSKLPALFLLIGLLAGFALVRI